MSLVHSPAAAVSSQATDIDLGLLEDTQAYLECLFRGGTPRLQSVNAWEEFYGLYGPVLRRFALACGVPRADLNDCLQEVWTELIEILRDFCYEPRRGRFSSWLYVLVHRKAINEIRRRNRHPTERLRDELVAALPSRETDPALDYEQHDSIEAVQNVLGSLRGQVSRRSYCVLHMRCLEGHTVAEIATALDLTLGQVRSRLHRMKQKFHRLFDLCARQPSMARDDPRRAGDSFKHSCNGA